MDPPTEDMYVANNRGRAGLIFFIVGGLFLLHGGKLLIPLPNDSQEEEVLEDESEASSVEEERKPEFVGIKQPDN